MAHLVETMAYAGATPWHGLGNQLTQKQPIEIWQREAGMDWAIQESSVHFKADTVGHLGTIHSFPEQKVLYRSDTKAPLSVVSQRYHTVQPREVLEFYRDLTEVSGYELETAGVLKGGRKFWALARTGQGAALKGKGHRGCSWVEVTRAGIWDTVGPSWLNRLRFSQRFDLLRAQHFLIGVLQHVSFQSR